jgi:hypothetical protein
MEAVIRLKPKICNQHIGRAREQPPPRLGKFATGSHLRHAVQRIADHRDNFFDVRVYEQDITGHRGKGCSALYANETPNPGVERKKRANAARLTEDSSRPTFFLLTA